MTQVWSLQFGEWDRCGVSICSSYLGGLLLMAQSTDQVGRVYLVACSCNHLKKSFFLK